MNNDNKDKYFKGQQSNEELVCFFRKHFTHLFPNFGFFFLIIGIELAFAFWITKLADFISSDIIYGILYVFAVATFTVYMHKYFLRLFSHFMHVCIFTNLRVIEHDKSLILHDDHETLDVAKIQDIQKFQDGLIRNFLGYGDLLVTLSSSKATKFFKHVPNINFHYRCLSGIKRDSLGRRYITYDYLDRVSGGLYAQLSETSSKVRSIFSIVR